MFKKWIAEDFTLSKRLVGILGIIAGMGVVIGSLGYDALRGSSDLGTTQQLIILVGIGAIIVGLTLLPLGDEPA